MAGREGGVGEGTSSMCTVAGAQLHVSRTVGGRLALALRAPRVRPETGGERRDKRRNRALTLWVSTCTPAISGPRHPVKVLGISF